MARCGCQGTACNCVIRGAGGVNVSGSGTVSNPYVIGSNLNLNVFDSATIDLSVVGDGSAEEPYGLSANLTAGLGDLNDVSVSGGSTGWVLALQSDGTYALAPPSTAAVGAINVGQGISGDGSSGAPLNVKLAPGSGLQINAQGLSLVSSLNWSSYTPSLTGNNGEILTLPAGAVRLGRYIQQGKLVTVSIHLDIPASFVPPVGRYGVTLPVPDRAGTVMRPMIPMHGFFTDDGTDPVPVEWKANRMGYGKLEGVGRINRIYVDRGGYSSAIGASYPRWRAYPIRMSFSGQYEAA